MSLPRFIGSATLLALLVTVAACSQEPAEAGAAGEAAAGSAGGGVPVFEYDSSFPQTPLPNEWILGELGGVDVDDQGHVWIIQRPWTVIGRELAAVTGEASCCRAAPSVIEFDAAGAVVQGWPEVEQFHAEAGTAAGQGASVGARGEDIFQSMGSGPGVFGDARREHTVYVDHNNFVWVTLDESHVILKFTREGQHVMTIGEPGVNRGSNDTSTLGRPAGLKVDPENNELYVSDGYSNKRVIVFDAETGAYKRHWGAYGNVPEDIDVEYVPGGPPPQQFVGPVHGIDISSSGMVFVADRSGDRIQVFQKDGTFVREGFVSPETRDAGTAYGVALSPDSRWAYVNDGSNNKIWILDAETLETVGSFSSYGRQGGQVMSAHSIAVDPQGNIYIGETRGRRVQKFAIQ